MSDDLEHINRRVAGLDNATPFTDVVNAINLAKEMRQQLGRIIDEGEAVAVEILRRDGPQTIGEVKYWAGATKTTKCRDLLPAIESLIAASGGDWGTFVECLSSNAIKHGTARKLYAAAGTPEQYDAHFETTEKFDLKDNGEKVPRLQSLNTAFIR